MPNIKKFTPDEIRERRKLAERRRKAKIKSDPIRAEELRRKDRERYHKKKAEGKIISLLDLPPQKRNELRRRNRKNFKAYYKRLKAKKTSKTMEPANQNIPVVTPMNTPTSRDNLRVRVLRSVGTASVASRTRSRLRYSDMEESEVSESSVSRPCSPNIFRTSSPCNLGSPQNPPSISTIQSPRSSVPPDSPQSCSSIDLVGNRGSKLANNFKKYQRQKNREIYKLHQVINELKREKECYKRKIQRIAHGSVKVCDNVIIHKNITPNIANKKNVQKTTQKTANDNIKSIVENFYERDDNSRLCPGKKEYITKHKITKQKRYLMTTIKDLYQKYLASHLPSISIFKLRRLKPFWVLKPDLKIRDTCLCKTHANIELVVKSLKQNHIINENSTSDILRSMTCNGFSVECLHRKCFVCKNKMILYKEFDNSKEINVWVWEKAIKPYKKDNEEKVANLIEKVKYTETPLQVIQRFEKLLIPFLTHVGNMNNQYNAMTYIKETPVSPNDCVIHIDFSENYSAKYSAEVQSVHFSRTQLALHTAIIYYPFLNSAAKERNLQSFCTVSECLRHDAAAVWAHLVPILEEIQKTAPEVDTLHIISDSPSSQYRNKKMFYIITQLSTYFENLTRIIWHYSESGHGKGAPDGIGGYLKRTADQYVAYGKDITNVETFVTTLQATTERVKLRTVEDYEITEKDWLIPHNLKSFPGSMNVHQVIWCKGENRLAFRSLSCTQQECLLNSNKCSHGKHLGFSDATGNKIKDANIEGYSVDINLSNTTRYQHTYKPSGRVERFKGSEMFVIKPPSKKNRKSTSVLLERPPSSNQLDSELNLSVDYEIPTPSCSFFDNLNSDAFAKYEKTTMKILEDIGDVENQKPVNKLPEILDESSSDYDDIFPKKTNKYFNL